MGRKKRYYVQKFDPTYDLQQKEYIGATIYWRENIIISWLRSNSHQLWHEKEPWKWPKEAWEEKVCTFFTFGVVESENHFILGCDAFRKVKDSYGSVVASIQWQWYCLFSEGFVRSLRQPIINLNRKMIELQKTKKQGDWYSHTLLWV